MNLDRTAGDHPQPVSDSRQSSPTPTPSPRPPTGIKQRGPNLWTVRVTRTNPRTGRRVHRRVRVAGTLADALIRRDRLRAELAQPPRDPPPPRVRLREYAGAWLRDRTPLLKPSVSKRYRLALDRHLLPALGDYFLQSLLPSDVRAYVAQRTDAGAAGNTVRNEFRLLRTISRDAMADRVCEYDFCARVRLPPGARWTVDRPNLLTADEFRRMFAKVPRYWRGLVALLATTGLRWGEATGLRWSDIREPDEAGHAEAIIRRANWKGREVPPKTPGSVRVVPILPEVLAYLGPREAPDALLFPTKRGTMHRGSVLRKVVDAACAAAGVRRITVHGLRRTFNNLARRNASREVVKEIMGHATDVMLAHYSVVDGEEKRNASAAVAGSLGLIRPKRVPPPADPSEHSDVDEE